MAIRPQQTLTSTTPPAIEVLSKTIQVKRTDTTAFDAFVLPKFAVVAAVITLVAAVEASVTLTHRIAAPVANVEIINLKNKHNGI